MSSPNRTRSMARTLSPLALHDALPDTSGLLAPSPTPDGTPCTCSVCCMFLTPARDFSTAASVRPASFRTPTFRNALHEGCVEPVVREALPFDQHRPLADRRQIRQADVGPLGNRPHVDQHRSRVALQARPRLVHRSGCNVDLTHVSLHL